MTTIAESTMTEKQQELFNITIDLTAKSIVGVLNNQTQKYPEEFAGILALPDGVKRLAQDAVCILLEKAEREAQEADVGNEILLCAGGSFITLNHDALINKVVELYNNKDNKNNQP